MYKNYIKIALRNIIRQKLSTFVNIIGLAVGLAGCLLIIGYVSHELSFEDCHTAADRIYRVDGYYTDGDVTLYYENMMAPLAKALQDECGFVREATTFNYAANITSAVGQNKTVSEQVFFVQPDFFDIFTFPFKEGDPKSSLQEPYTAVVTENFAGQLFGAENPIGQSLIINDDYQCRITGIVQNPPRNTQFQFDFLISHATLNQLKVDIDNWDNIGKNYVYVLLDNEADEHKLSTQIPAVMSRHLPSETVQKYSMNLTPLKDIYLHSSYFEKLSPTGNLFYVYLLSGIALLILLIACINYINLSTARSINRLKEVGLRKVLGAKRRQLIVQILIESLTITIIAMIIGMVLYDIARPYYNNFVGRQIVTEIYSSPGMFAVMIGLTVLVGVIAGSFTAFYTTRFKPLKLFYYRSMLKTSKSYLRKGLVTVQFVIAVGLIFVCLAVNKQINFLKSYDRGFDKENIMILNPTGAEAAAQCALLKKEILNNTDIRQASAMLFYPGESAMTFRPFDFEDGENKRTEHLQCLYVDRDYLSTFNIELLQGRNFSEEFEGQPFSEIIVNQKLVDTYGIDDPLNYSLSYNNQRIKIVGVVKDFNSLPMKIELRPTALVLRTDIIDKLAVRLDEDKLGGQIAAVKDIWSRIIPDQVFSYFFLDDKLNSAYGEEERMRSLFLVASILAILIACLGAFGLAAFAAEQRTHEIGIRKVLGASLINIVRLISNEFVVLTGIACLIAWPLAYYLVNKSMQDFPYRVNFGLDIIILSGAVCLSVVLATVGFQAFKAALANPVDTLKHE